MGQLSLSPIFHTLGIFAYQVLEQNVSSNWNWDLCWPAISEGIVQHRETSPPCLVCSRVSVCDNVHNSCNNFNISKTLSTSGGWWPGLVAASGRTLLGSLFKDTPPPPHYTLPHLAWSSISNLQGRTLVTKFTNLCTFSYFHVFRPLFLVHMDKLVKPNLELDIFENPRKIFFLFAQCSPVRPAGGDHLAATFPFHISAMLQLLVFNLPHEKCLEHSEAASSSTD